MSERYYRRAPNPLSASLPSQALRASSPKGRALGISVKFPLDEQGLSVSWTVVPCCLGQRQLDKVRCPEAAALCSEARPFAPQWSPSGQLRPDRHANGSPFGSNGDDRRQRRKQGGAVGAAASRMRAAAKQTLGAATRAVSPKVTEREAICPKNLSKFWKINLKAFSHKSGKLCYNHNYGQGRGCAALTENNEEGGEPYGTVPLQALWCNQKRR